MFGYQALQKFRRIRSSAFQGKFVRVQRVQEEIVHLADINFVGEIDRGHHVSQRPLLLHELERPERVELRLVVVRDDEVELGVEVGSETLFVLNSTPGGIEASAPELAKCQVCVLRPVLEDQQA